MPALNADRVQSQIEPRGSQKKTEIDTHTHMGEGREGGREEAGTGVLETRKQPKRRRRIEREETEPA